METRSVFAAVILTLLLSAPDAPGTEFRLKNGNVIVGTVVEEDDETIMVKLLQGGVARFRRSEIAEVIDKPTPLEEFRAKRQKLADGDITGRLNLADYCMKEARPRLTIQAARLYREILEKDPDHVAAKERLLSIIRKPARKLDREAERLSKQGDFADARDKLMQLAKRYPETRYAKKAQHKIAQTYLDQGRLDDATRAWQKALEADRYHVESYLGILEICKRRRKWDKCIDIIDGVLAFAKDGELKRQLSADRGVLRKLSKLAQDAEERPEDPKTPLAVAEQLSVLGREEAAIEALEKAVRLGAQNAEAFKTLAEYHEEKLNIMQAIRYWRLAREADLDGPIGALADRRIPKLELLALIPRYLLTDDRAERDNIVKKLEGSSIPFSLMEAVARRGYVFEAEPSGIRDGTIELPRRKRHGEYSYVVPRGYDPAKPCRTILALHGRGSSGANYVLLWADLADKTGTIVVAPTAPEGSWSQLGRSMALKALLEVREKYNIDPDRILVSGTSFGAEAAWHLALQYPHLFAGMASRSGRLPRLDRIFLPNLLHVPVYIVHGALDTTFPVVDMRQVHKELNEIEREHVYHERREGRHGPFINENEPIMEWFRDKKRPAFPREVVKWTRNLDWGRGRAYWLRILGFKGKIYDPTEKIVVPKVGGKPLDKPRMQNYIFSMAMEGTAKVKASIKGNTIDVRTKHVKAYTIFLNDEMVDLERPVIIRTNGDLSFKGECKRDIGFLLEWLRRNRDASQVFSTYKRIITNRPEEH